MTTTTVLARARVGKNQQAMTDDDPRLLFTRHVARVWSDALDGVPVSRHTVSSYRRKSLPADPAAGRNHDGRYVNDPVPAPAGFEGRQAYWTPEQVPDLVAWIRRRRGRIGDPRSENERGPRGQRT